MLTQDATALSSTSGLDGFSNKEQRWAFLSDLCVSGSLLGGAVCFREDLSSQSFQSAALKIERVVVKITINEF